MATSLNTPDVLTQPLAQNGDKNAIPNTNDPALGQFSQSLGFPPVCSQRIADGGKAPRRADMNGALNLISQQHYFFQNGGTETFRTGVSSAIGGYPLGARLWYLSSTGTTMILRSAITNNTNNFNTDPSVIGSVGSGKPWIIESFALGVNDKYVTNCPVEVPQNIKIELSSGTLTLKSGTIYYTADGSEYQLTADRSVTSTASGQMVVFPRAGGSPLCMPIGRVYSGATEPTITTPSAVWYDMTNNVIKNTSDYGATWGTDYGFPVALVTGDGTQIVSIDQVLNGVGFIGNCVYVLPDVKYLIPNGRNADGTLKNTEVITSAIYVSANNDENRTNVYLYSNQRINRIASTSYVYDPATNYHIRQSDGAVVDVCFVAFLTTRPNHIDAMNSRPVFHAVDYWEEKNDIAKLEQQAQVDFANAVGTPRDVTILWGNGTGVDAPSWFELSEDFTNFEMLGYLVGSDSGYVRGVSLISTYWLDWCLKNTSSNSSVCLGDSGLSYTAINSYNHNSYPSTKTLFYVNGQNSVSYYIFGINRKQVVVPDPLS